MTPTDGSVAWAASVNEWDGAEYHSRIVGPFDTYEQAVLWVNACGEDGGVFALVSPDEWVATSPKTAYEVRE